jgi:hypothetical protein
VDPGETRCGAERGGSNFAIAVRFGASLLKPLRRLTKRVSVPLTGGSALIKTKKDSLTCLI